MWNMCGARQQVTPQNSPVRSGIVAMQEVTVMTEVEYWEAYG